MKVLALWDGMGGVEYHRLYVPLKRLLIDHADEIEVEVSQEFNKSGLPNLKQYDLVIFNRWLGNDHYEILHYMAKHSIPYIVDIDDFWELPKYHPTYKFFRENKLKSAIIDAIRYADGVTTTTPQLADEIKKLNRNVKILPNALDVTDEHWVASPQQRDVFTFGWVGSLIHSNDIMIISDAIARICDEYGDKVRFVICGWMPNNYVWDSILYKFNGSTGVLRPQVVVSAAQAPNEYGNFYRLFDCALAPLEDNKWNNCKSELKIIEAAAYKLPVIASNVNPYINHAENYGVHFTDNTPDAWYKSMKHFLDSPESARILGDNNYHYCKEHHDLDKINLKRLEFYKCTSSISDHS